MPLAFHHCANTTFPRTLFYFSLLSASIIFSYSSVLLDFVIASFLWSQEMCNFQVRTEFPPSTSPFIQGSTHWCNTSRINIRISDPFSPVWWDGSSLKIHLLVTPCLLPTWSCSPCSLHSAMLFYRPFTFLSHFAYSGLKFSLSL